MLAGKVLLLKRGWIILCQLAILLLQQPAIMLPLRRLAPLVLLCLPHINGACMASLYLLKTNLVRDPGS